MNCPNCGGYIPPTEKQLQMQLLENMRQTFSVVASSMMRQSQILDELRRGQESLVFDLKRQGGPDSTAAEEKAREE